MTQLITQIRLSNLIAPSFFGVHKAIKQSQYTHYWLKGGRGSTKSSFVAIEIILGMIQDPQANATVLCKVGDTLENSVWKKYQWAVDKLGLTHLWKATVKPRKLTYLPTKQEIVFMGADDPRKIKSSTFRKGYNKYTHYEEVDEFGNIDDIEHINRSLLRGGVCFAFYSFNPPKSKSSWIVAKVGELALRDNVLVHHSDYLSVDPNWLDKTFIDDADYCKNMTPTKYEHEYLGLSTGTGAEVFGNLDLRKITDQEIATFDNISRGLDFGYASHPSHYTANHYDKHNLTLYIYQEIHKSGMKARALASSIKPLAGNSEIIADSAEPRTIDDLKDLGLNAKPAKKEQGSRDHGMKWLQDLSKIVIDPERCPNTAREFVHYELLKDAHGNFRDSYPDKDDHSIDAVRYSCEYRMKKGGVGFY